MLPSTTFEEAPFCHSSLTHLNVAMVKELHTMKCSCKRWYAAALALLTTNEASVLMASGTSEYINRRLAGLNGWLAGSLSRSGAMCLSLRMEEPGMRMLHSKLPAPF